jgi:hypothetical protein
MLKPLTALPGLLNPLFNEFYEDMAALPRAVSNRFSELSEENKLIANLALKIIPIAIAIFSCHLAKEFCETTTAEDIAFYTKATLEGMEKMGYAAVFLCVFQMFHNASRNDLGELIQNV